MENIDINNLDKKNYEFVNRAQISNSNSIKKKHMCNYVGFTTLIMTQSFK